MGEEREGEWSTPPAAAEEAGWPARGWGMGVGAGRGREGQGVGGEAPGSGVRESAQLGNAARN